MTARDDYPRLAHLADNPEYGELYKQCQTALDEIDQLRAAIWKAYGILGFDTDGDDHYAGTLPIDEFLIQFCTEHRKDYDDAINEAIG